MIPYAKQSLSQADIDAVTEVLRSDWLTQGPTIPAFEKAIAEYCDANYGLAVSSGTAALHLACLALGLGPGDSLWTTPNTFVASANCALYCGASVDFVDIDPSTYNMSTQALREKLEHAQRQGSLPKIIIPVHFAGQPCDMGEISLLATEFGVYVIEDASHALGAKYAGNRVGNCQHSDITVFSFHPAKMITTGEGGLLLTNQEKLYSKAKKLRHHGITREAQPLKSSWKYTQTELGFNYRLTDIQAALGLSQLNELDTFVERRQQLATRYNSLLADLPLTLPYQSEQGQSSWHLYVIQLKESAKHNRTHVYEKMRETDIGVNVHYIPVHTQPYYQDLGFHSGQFPVAEAYYEHALTLPLFTELTETDQDYVVQTLTEHLSD